MLDQLPVGAAQSLDDLREACICFEADDPTPDDSVGSDPVDLATSGWTFPGYEDDDSKNWHFESFRAEIEGVDGDHFRVRVRCQLANWQNDTIVVGEADLVTVGRGGAPPLYDETTGQWSAPDE